MARKEMRRRPSVAAPALVLLSLEMGTVVTPPGNGRPWVNGIARVRVNEVEVPAEVRLMADDGGATHGG